MDSGYEEELNQIRETIDETFNKLCKLWDEIGSATDGKREERKATIAASCKNHICQYLDRVYAAEDQKRIQLLKSIKEEEDTVNGLSTKLGVRVNYPWKTDASDQVYPLRVIESQMKQWHEQLATKYGERKVESVALLEKLKALYQDLGEKIEDCFSNPDDFLTENKMSFLKERYQELSHLKDERIKTKNQLVDILHNFYSLLGITLENQDNDVDNLVLSNSPISVTTSMLDHISKRLKELRALETSRREVIDNYYKQIYDLWKLLETPAEEVDAFSAKCQINLSVGTIQLHKDYLLQLQDQVKDRLTQLIPAVRQEIQSVIDYIYSYSNVLQTWDLSLLEAPEESYTMELFERHKQLYEQLQEARSALDPVVEKINKREKLLHVRVELEALRSNPKRYSDRRYSNKYLQEEIQMSKEIARLPFVNKECRQVISQYEAQYGEVIVNGKRYYDELKDEELIAPRKSIISTQSRLHSRR